MIITSAGFTPTALISLGLGTVVTIIWRCEMTIMAYMDIDRKLPVAAIYDHTRQDGTIMRESDIEFEYPRTGPADIYEAGAPKSAQIKPDPNP